eukprot:m.35981 g.35981  ORF g.35981 m.35981 type:complete len:297 (+) comp32196_c0_seq2:30-920(+)
MQTPRGDNDKGWLFDDWHPSYRIEFGDRSRRSRFADRVTIDESSRPSRFLYSSPQTRPPSQVDVDRLRFEEKVTHFAGLSLPQLLETQKALELALAHKLGYVEELQRVDSMARESVETPRKPESARPRFFHPVTKLPSAFDENSLQTLPISLSCFHSLPRGSVDPVKKRHDASLGDVLGDKPLQSIILDHSPAQPRREVDRLAYCQDDDEVGLNKQAHQLSSAVDNAELTPALPYNPDGSVDQREASVASVQEGSYAVSERYNKEYEKERKTIIQKIRNEYSVFCTKVRHTGRKSR